MSISAQGRTGVDQEKFFRLQAHSVLAGDANINFARKCGVDDFIISAYKQPAHGKGFIAQNERGILTDTLHAVVSNVPDYHELAVSNKRFPLQPDELHDIRSQQELLTPSEREWLTKHPVIRVSNEMDWPPYDFMENGRPVGYSIDYLNLIARKLGIKFKYINGYSWAQLVEKFEGHEIDVIHPLAVSENRKKLMNFSPAYFHTSNVLVGKKGRKKITSLQDLYGKKLAIGEGYIFQEVLTRDYPQIEIYLVKNALEGLKAVSFDKADAFIDTLGTVYYLKNKHFMSNLEITAELDLERLGFISYHLGIRKDWPQLSSIIAKAMRDVTIEEDQALIRKWNIYAEHSKTINLTEQERRWLEKHRNIKLAIDPEFAPIEFIDKDGIYSGVAADYVRLLNERLDISMRIVPDLSWSEVITLAKDESGEIDVFPAITPTAERKKYLNFTNPYFNYPFVVFTREDYPVISGIESLINKKVVVVNDYVTSEMMDTYHPEIELVTVKSIREGLSFVSVGKADAFIGDIATTAYAIRKFNFTNIKISSPVDFSTEGHAFAVRKDWPQLVSILNKGLDSITAEERLYISKKWVGIEVEKFPKYWVWVALGTAGLAAIFVGVSGYLRIQIRKRTMELTQKNITLKKEIAEREDIEKELIRSERRLYNFFYATFEMVFFHENGMIVDVNPAVMRMTGYKPEMLVGNHVVDFVEKDSKNIVLASLSSLSEDPVEINIIKCDKNIMPVEVHAATFQSDEKKIRVVSLRDISEQRRSELALKEAHHLLEKKVEERTRELVEANEKLKELDQLKSMFIASVSHELRTPLNSVIGFSSIMMNGTFGSLSDKYQDYIGRINRSGVHLLSLITDIIDISKIESGHIDTVISEVNVEHVMVEACDNIRQQIEEKGVLLYVYAQAGLTLYTDKRRLYQCVLNFINNAMKFTESGCVTVVAGAINKRVLISVCDTGIGISDVNMKHLFEPFERFNTHLRVKAGGTGLGLYLTKKIVKELLHGEINVDSREGCGSNFWIKLPESYAPQSEEIDNVKEIECGRSASH